MMLEEFDLQAFLLHVQQQQNRCLLLQPLQLQ
jgi:hypothetical protein